MATYFNANQIKRGLVVTIQLANGLTVELTRVESGSIQATHPLTGEQRWHDARGMRITLAQWEAEVIPAEPTPEPPATNGKVFGYVRVSTKSQTVDGQVEAIQQAYPEATIYSDHGVSGKIPALERPELGKLLTHGLRSGDTLVVWWVDRLGRDYEDVVATMRRLLSQCITIQTINQSMTFTYQGGTQAKMMTDVMITMLAGMAAADRENRLASAEAGRQALRQNPEAWAERFKGRRPDEDKHQAIVTALAAGGSIRGVAKALGCDPSTVQRVKRKYIKVNP